MISYDVVSDAWQAVKDSDYIESAAIFYAKIGEFDQALGMAFRNKWINLPVLHQGYGRYENR